MCKSSIWTAKEQAFGSSGRLLRGEDPLKLRLRVRKPAKITFRKCSAGVKVLSR